MSYVDFGVLNTFVLGIKQMFVWKNATTAVMNAIVHPLFTTKNLFAVTDAKQFMIFFKVMICHIITI